MDAEEKPTFSSRQSLVRDRFIFIALRELGLRASELTGATMSSFYRLSDPKDGGTYSGGAGSNPCNEQHRTCPSCCGVAGVPTSALQHTPANAATLA